MRTVVRIFTISLLAIFLSVGCTQQQPEDIKLSELKTACEYVDAVEICLNSLADMEAKYGEDADESELSSEDRARVIIIQEIVAEIIQELPKKFDMADVLKCPNFEKVEEASKKYF